MCLIFVYVYSLKDTSWTWMKAMGWSRKSTSQSKKTYWRLMKCHARVQDTRHENPKKRNTMKRRNLGYTECTKRVPCHTDGTLDVCASWINNRAEDLGASFLPSDAPDVAPATAHRVCAKCTWGHVAHRIYLEGQQMHSAPLVKND